MCDFTEEERELVFGAIQFKLSTAESQELRERYHNILGKL
jgi:hypothetical protein